MSHPLLKTKKKHDSALADLYAHHGVGDTNKHRLAFWKSRHPDGYSISCPVTESQEVAIMETSWLTETFPGDFEFY